MSIKPVFFDTLGVRMAAPVVGAAFLLQSCSISAHLGADLCEGGRDGQKAEAYGSPEVPAVFSEDSGSDASPEFGEGADARRLASVDALLPSDTGTSDGIRNKLQTVGRIRGYRCAVQRLYRLPFGVCKRVDDTDQP